MPSQKKGVPEVVDLSTADAQAMLERIKPVVSESDFVIITWLVETVMFLVGVLEGKNASISKLRHLIFGQKTERAKNILGSGDEKASADRAAKAKRKGEKKKHKGHGRNGASKYVGAEVIFVPIKDMKAGDGCPECERGKAYKWKPKVIVCIRGHPPISATLYELECLRCNTCGAVFTAALPEGVSHEKYDETARATIALLKYGYGVPLKRLEMIQDNRGVPLPVATQWEVVEEAGEKIYPVYRELVRLAAQGELVQNDDTPIKILDLGLPDEPRDPEENEEQEEEEESSRKGTFANCVMSKVGKRFICLFLTGTKHAGEALAEVLQHRDPKLPPPTQMSDGHLRNSPKGHATVPGNCNVHARRKFVEVFDNFPQECEVVIEMFKKVYEVDAEAKKTNMTPHQRLSLHKARSGPVMEDLHRWLNKQFDEKLVEPNSGLGKAINYMRKRWDKLTLFLRRPGVPLDNNLVERALKRVILVRKNSLFFKTLHGAEIGDVYMSLFQTCLLAGVNAFDYLVTLQKHAGQVKHRPADWLPWNYSDVLKSLTASN